MSKKIILFFISIVFFSSFQSAQASLMINEVMYDLPGADNANNKSREWIEVYNPDGSDVLIDASKWRIYDGSANRTINDQVDFSIPTGAYVILAGDKDTFLTDYPNFGEVVYDTGITSLNNTGANLKILDQDGNTVDSVIYSSSQGGTGDGNSLQKKGGTWTGVAPTPGATNEPAVASSSISITSSNGNPSTQTAVTPETKSKIAEEPKIKTQISAKNIVFVDIPLSFQATVFGYSKEKLFYGKYFWNFGDGDSKEMPVVDNQQFTHTYFYPGDYVVALEYYINSYSNIPDASDKIIIKVVSADIAISAVGNEKDFFVELTNNTNYDADISYWILKSGAKNFTFPKNTIVSSQKKMTLSSNLTYFSITDKDTLKLMTSQGKTVFDYGASAIVPVVAVSTKTVVQSKSKISVSQDQINSGTVKPLPENLTLPASNGKIPVENLAASASANDVIKNNPIRSYIWGLVFIIFVGASAGAVYFIRQKKIGLKKGDDFTILDG